MSRSKDADIRLLSTPQYEDADEDEDEDADEESQHSARSADEVLTVDDQVLERLQHLEKLLSSRPGSTAKPVARRQDGFSVSTVDSEQEDIFIRVRNQVQQIPSESLQDDIGRALLSAIGASYGAQLGGPTGAGIGAALASFLHSRKRVNPLDALFGRREQR